MKLISGCLATAVLVGCGSDKQRDMPNATQPQLHDVEEVDSAVSIANSDFLMLAGTKGNGGDAVVCFQGTLTRDQVHEQLVRNRHSPVKINPFKDAEVMRAVTKVEILDLFEFQMPSGFPPVQRKLVEVTGSFQDELPKIIARIGQVSGFGERLEREMSELPFRNWRKADGVVDVDDSAEVFFLPPECLLVQAAVRQDNQVFYDVHLWDRMDELNRLALVVHELVYKVAASNNQSTSEKARQAVGMILSESELTELEGWEVYEKLKSLGDFSFHYTFADQDLNVLKVFKTFPNGAPRSMKVEPIQHLKVGNTFWGVDVQDSANFTLATPESLESLTVFGGTTPEFHFAVGESTTVTFINNVPTHIRFQKPSAVHMHNGTAWTQVRMIATDLRTSKVLVIEGNSMLETSAGTVSVGGQVVLNENGLIKQATWAQLIRPNIQLTGDEIFFDDNGNVTEFRSVIDSRNGCPSTFSEGIYTFGICKTNLMFFANGRLKALKFTNTSPDATGRITWNNSNQSISGATSVEISEDSTGLRVVTGQFGEIYNFKSDPKIVPAPLSTIEILNGEIAP